MDRRIFLDRSAKSSFAILALPGLDLFQATQSMKTSIRQITHGEENHFFGYIGQSKTIPWNLSGKRILALRTNFLDHLPDGNEPAGVVLVNLDKPEGDYYKVEKVDQSLGWNPQQGTMYYWNPDNQASQFFFNDRDPKTGKVFTVLFDIDKVKRIKEYRFDDTPVGNSGVCPVGKSFLAINYARMARLRPVTGYKGATDWTDGFGEGTKNYYTIIRLNDGKWVRTEGVNKGEYSGDIRIDPAPCWNRQNNQILVSGITENGTRQLFIVSIN